MKRTFALLAFATLCFTSCGEEQLVAPSVAANDVGEVSLQLRVPAGFRFSVVNYDIAGGLFHKAGQLNVASSSTISGVIRDIPVGVGYVVTLSAIDDDHRLRGCHGSATTDILAAATTAVTVPLSCEPASRVPTPVPNSPLANVAYGVLLLIVGSKFARQAQRR